MSPLVRQERAELLDDPPRVSTDLAANLADIRLLNRWFGGTRQALQYVRPALRAGEATSVLDVATGSADIPLTVLRWCRAHQREVDITAVDLSPEVLRVARECVGTEDIRLIEADARHLPWPDGRFDLVLCCLALHHFTPSAATAALTEMWRVTRRRLIVLDLSRSYVAYGGAWLATHLVARNRLTRHDGPLSVLRAYTADELRKLAAGAGLPYTSRVHRNPFFRLALVADREVGIDD